MLRAGLRPERALDIVHVVLTVDGYLDLTQRGGWTQDEWRAWMVDLLGHEPGRPRRHAAAPAPAASWSTGRHPRFAEV